MKNMTTFLTIVWVGLFFGIGWFLCPNYTSAFSGPAFDPAQMEYIEIKAEVMEVNIEKSYVVVAEKYFDVTEYKIGDDIHKTTLEDAAGEEIPLESLTRGQQVIVKGIKLSKDRFVADSIQLKVGGNNLRNQYQLIPKAQSIKPLKQMTGEGSPAP